MRFPIKKPFFLFGSLEYIVVPPTESAPWEVLFASILACTVRASCSALKRADPESGQGKVIKEGNNDIHGYLKEGHVVINCDSTFQP